MKRSILATASLVLLSVAPLMANASEFVYKKFTLDIPSCEVTGGGIVNLPPYDAILLQGKSWDMTFSDSLFMETCLLLSEKLSNTFSCEEANRIQMLDNVITENSLAVRILFSAQSNTKINRQEFKDYILYSSAGIKKHAIAILVEKETGKTTEINGAFTDEQLKWLRLAPL